MANVIGCKWTLLLLSATAVDCLVTKKSDDGAAGTDGSSNLCIDGRLAPELILFGPARASTSTFARNLIKSSGVRYGACIEADHLNYKCPDIGLKEMHFFSVWDGSENHYLEHYPVCQTKSRIVAADLTPGYHTNPDTIQRISDFYGGKKDRVKFIMLLRNPIKCMQSFFYYEHQEKKGPFVDHVEHVLKTNSSRYMKNALYAPALEKFFSVFDPSQLTIVPMQYNEAEKNGQPRITDHLFEQLGLPQPEADDSAVDRWNYNDGHPSVETDLDGPTTERLQSRLDEFTGAKLVGAVIAEAVTRIGHGPHLYGYNGSPSDAAAISAWLENGW